MEEEGEAPNEAGYCNSRNMFLYRYDIAISGHHPLATNCTSLKQRETVNTVNSNIIVLILSHISSKDRIEYNCREVDVVYADIVLKDLFGTCE